MANGSFTGQDIADAARTAVNVGSYAHKVGSLAGWGMPGVFGTLAGPVGYGIKAATDIYAASPTKPGFWGRLWDLQLRPLRRLGILSTSQADAAYGGYGTAEAEQEGVAGIDTGASGHAREVTGPVDVTGLTLGGSEFGFDPDRDQRGPDQAQVDANISRSRSLATMDWDESDPDTSTDTDTGDFQDPDDIDYGHDEEDWADGGYVQKYADGDFVEQTLMGFPLGGPASSGKKVPSLDNSTTSELLMLQAAIKRLGAPYKPKLHMRAEPGFDYDKANTALVLQAPESGLPAFHAFASGGRPPEGSFAKGTPQSFGDAGYGVSQPLGRGSVSFERKTSRADEKGRRIPALQSDRISLNNPYGLPLTAFYQEGEQPGGVESTSRGGSFAVGPLTLSGSKDKFSQGKNRTNVSNVEANVRTPISKRGILRAGAGRHQVEALYNQIRQMQRRTDKVNLGLDFTGDGSAYGATGTIQQVEDGPRTRSVQGFYNMQNPLGLGGDFRATGSFVDPEIGKNALEAMLRYGVKF